MDNLFNLIDIPWWYFLIAAGIVIVLTIGTRKLSFSLLVGYMFLVFADTVLIRTPGSLRYELLPFWSYRDYFNGTDTYLMKQIIANVIMFIPMGVLAGMVRGWKGIYIGACFSVIIEVTQLITQRGLFEFDDIIHNTIGTIAGVAMFMLMHEMWRRTNGISIEPATKVDQISSDPCGRGSGKPVQQRRGTDIPHI